MFRTVSVAGEWVARGRGNAAPDYERCDVAMELARLEPQNIDEAARLAEMAVRSRLYSVQSVEAALMILLTGRDLGLTASQSFRGIYIVSGKPVVSSDAMVAAVRRSGHCASWRVVESTPERCTITTLRTGETEPETESWTLEDARRAGLLNKDVWKAYPRDMLRHRTAAALARRVYPDVILGCYAEGEMRDDDRPLPVAVSVAESPQQTPALGGGWLDRIAAANTGKALVALAVDLEHAHANGLQDAILSAYAAQWRKLISRALDAGSIDAIARVWMTRVPAAIREVCGAEVQAEIESALEALKEREAISAEAEQ